MFRSVTRKRGGRPTNLSPGLWPNNKNRRPGHLGAVAKSQNAGRRSRGLVVGMKTGNGERKSGDVGEAGGLDPSSSPAGASDQSAQIPGRDNPLDHIIRKPDIRYKIHCYLPSSYAGCFDGHHCMSTPMLRMLPSRCLHNMQGYLTSFISFVMYPIFTRFACFHKPRVDPRYQYCCKPPRKILVWISPIEVLKYS